MFQSARPNTRAYVFFKGSKPRLEQGYVVNQPLLRPKYTLPTTFGQPQETVLDLTIKTETGTYNFTGLPSNLEIADTFYNGEAAVVSDSKDAMNAEVLSIKQKSVDAIESVDYHKDIVVACDTIIGQLNPEYAERQERDAELNMLKNTVSDLSGKLDLLIGKLSLKTE